MTETLRRLSIAAAALALAACRTPTAPGDLDKPVFGHHRETQFIVETDRSLNAHELGRIGRTIRRYKVLTQAEADAVRSQLAEEIESLVAVEVRDLQPDFNREEARLDEMHRRTMKSLQGDAPGRARAEAEHVVAVKQLAADLHARARQRVLARLGGELALPLRTSDNRSVVAFGRMDGEQLQVTSEAYEVDLAAAQMRAGMRITRNDGSRATVVGSRAQVQVNAPTPAR